MDTIKQFVKDHWKKAVLVAALAVSGTYAVRRYTGKNQKAIEQ